MMVRYKHDGNVYAMKMLRKENIIKRNQVEHTKTERNVLESISHPFIVQLYFAFQTPKKLYFVMEWVTAIRLIEDTEICIEVAFRCFLPRWGRENVFY